MTEQIGNGKSAARAIVDAGEFFIDLLGHSENDYIRQRAADIEEICLQLLEEVGATAAVPALELSAPSVLVAETLGPQQLLRMDRQWLKAIVLEHSGTTSHAAILARSLGIPTLAGVRNARLTLVPGKEIVVDADRGFLIPQVSALVTRFYEQEQKTLTRRNQLRSHAESKAAVISDGERIEVAANASSGEESTLGFANGADGIGLFRTEMIFLGREDAPSEDEQYAVYSEVARNAKNRPVIIRTFDFGGVKKVPYLNLPREENPFLGYRGVRIYNEHRELLQSQLRAILRASAVGTRRVRRAHRASPPRGVRADRDHLCEHVHAARRGTGRLGGSDPTRAAGEGGTDRRGRYVDRPRPRPGRRPRDRRTGRLRRLRQRSGLGRAAGQPRRPGA